MLAVLIAIALTSLAVTRSVQATATTFSNTIQDEPEVECGHGTITVKVKTASQKPSYIFAKGHFHKDGCHFKQTSSATFRFEECNVNRKREVNPRGMAYSLTVIVQLHPLFITKVDRAYNVRCFYMEENKEVDAALQVSDLTTSVLESGHAMPQCSYTLHRDSPNGPVLRYARVGDVVFHVWDCPSDVYAMLIHSCYILDGQGGEHQVVDDKGCSTDDFILPQLTYSNDLSRSFTGASVVNLPDRESIYFSCQVKLCFKRGDYCTNVTPPNCGDHLVEEATKEAELKPKHIEDDLRNDQLLFTTAGHLATSKPVRIVPTAPPPAVLSSKAPTQQSDASSRPHVQTSSSSRQPLGITGSIRYISELTVENSSTMNSTNTASTIPTTPRIMEFLEKQATNLTDAIRDIEGSGEDDDLLSTVAVNTITSTGKTATTNFTTIITAKKSTSRETPAKGTATTVHLTSTREPNPTRGRRTVPESDYKIVDLDVSTSQVKILDEGFDLPEFPAKSSSLNDRREGAVCLPVLTMWLLSGVSLVSVSIAIATVMYSRLANRKMALFYRY